MFGIHQSARRGVGLVTPRVRRLGSSCRRVIGSSCIVVILGPCMRCDGRAIAVQRWK
jgi:hypothetical protein